MASCLCQGISLLALLALPSFATNPAPQPHKKEKGKKRADFFNPVAISVWTSPYQSQHKNNILLDKFHRLCQTSSGVLAMTARGRRNQRANPECPYRPATCVLGAATHHQDYGLQDWGTAGARCQVSGVRAITKNADCRMVEAPGRWLRRLSGNPTEELMDSRAFKASRSRRGNEIESRMSVFSIIKTRGGQGSPLCKPRDLTSPRANYPETPSPRSAARAVRDSEGRGELQPCGLSISSCPARPTKVKGWKSRRAWEASPALQDYNFLFSSSFLLLVPWFC